MKFTTFTLVSAIAACVSAAPVRRDVDPSLIPEFGFASGLNPTGTGDCDGAVKNASGQAVKIPCACPPSRESFIQSLNANVAAGKAVNNPSVSVSFPTDNSKASRLARIGTALVTLQNLNGVGKGCPAASTTFVVQQKAIQAETDTGAAPAAPIQNAPVVAPVQNAPVAAAPAPSTGGVDPALVPEFGFSSGLNPTGTGDCDGVVPGVKIPCACPPARDVFLKSLNENVAAGKVVNNPTVAVSFPTDNSKASKLARIGAALVTLQNLNGSGKGCPASSTKFVAQQKAIQAEADDNTAAPAQNAPAAPVQNAPAAPTSANAPVPTAPSTSPVQNAPVSAGGVDPALVPEFGFSSGLNPTGTGDCDGAVKGANGSPIKIPCSCPPSREDFLKSLSANVAAGVATNNPTVKVSFPTDDSKGSKAARLIASLITLQNLNGPGKGCPAAATTFGSQLKAFQ